MNLTKTIPFSFVKINISKSELYKDELKIIVKKFGANSKKYLNLTNWLKQIVKQCG